jgi:bifunctional non-homologous end joining protein LigD
VKLTHPDRVYWPDAGVTKQGLADYYAAAWPRIEPLVVNRPLALLRCPGGTGSQCFFQKHPWKGHGQQILTPADPLNPDDPPLIAIDGLSGLVALVQGAALEIHAWQSTLADLEHPDQIVMDLDPGEGVSWPAMIAAAREVRARLEAAGLAAFVKTSGGKGLHVLAPLKPTRSAGWTAVKAFTARMARAMAADAPDRYVATIAKAKRPGRILIDYLRNGRNNTAVIAYGARARPGAPVSMPLAWDDLGPAIGPAHFTVANAPARIAAAADPWADFRRAEAPLPRGK